MAKPQLRLSFWPENERNDYTAPLYKELQKGPYGHFEYILLTELSALGYAVPEEALWDTLGLWDGLVEGFLNGIFSGQDTPSVNPERLTQLRKVHEGRFLEHIYHRVCLEVYPLGHQDGRWVLTNLRSVPPLEDVNAWLARLYFRERGSQPGHTGSPCVFDVRRSIIEGILAELLRTRGM